MALTKGKKIAIGVSVTIIILIIVAILLYFFVFRKKSSPTSNLPTPPVNSPTGYFPSTLGSCSTNKVSYGKVFNVLRSDCDKIAGKYNKLSNGNTPAPTDWVDCYSDICNTQPLGQNFVFASPSTPGGTAGNCSGNFIYGVMANVTKNDCDTMGGKYNGTPSGTDVIECSMNICTDQNPPANYFYMQGTGKCPTGKKVTSGTSFLIPGADCTAMGGTFPGSASQAWVNCNMDICKN